MSDAKPFQVIDTRGDFDVEGFKSYVNQVGLANCGLSYAVVAIIGAQSSGKSTLLNHLFATTFREMDETQGRNQTTLGVWVARAAGIEPFTLVIDLEGTDSGERGEDDTLFEKQSSLLALTVADILLVNIWCHDLGRDHATNRQLLGTMFTAMMRLFTPRKMTLLFVLRDKTKSPLETLDKFVRESTHQVWNSVEKPDRFKGTSLSDVFNIEVAALSNYENKPEVFRQEVAELRKRFVNSIQPGGLASDRSAVVPATGFALSLWEIWKVIKGNKDLDLPAHQVMVAATRCEEISGTCVANFSEEWKAIEDDVKAGSISGFGNIASLLLDKYLSGYDSEAAYYEENVRSAKRERLVSSLVAIVRPVQEELLLLCQDKAKAKFKEEFITACGQNEAFSVAARRSMESCLTLFDRDCRDIAISQGRWDTSESREEVRREITETVSALQEDEVKKAFATAKERLQEALVQPAASLLESASSTTWPSLRKLLSRETEAGRSKLSSGLGELGLDRNRTTKMLDDLTIFGRFVLEEKMQSEAGRTLVRMKERFVSVFTQDDEAMPRVWNAKVDIKSVTAKARLAAIKFLSVIAVLRYEVDYEQVDYALSTLLKASDSSGSSGSSSSTETALAGNKWDGVPVADMLLTPIECKSLWGQLRSETEYLLRQALSAQEASQFGVSKWPPAWSILAIIVLGWNEFMFFICNPLYLLLVLLAYLVGKAAWVQLDVRRELEQGMILGALSISGKLLPGLTTIASRLISSGRDRLHTNGTPDRHHLS